MSLSVVGVIVGWIILCMYCLCYLVSCVCEYFVSGVSIVYRYVWMLSWLVL